MVTKERRKCIICDTRPAYFGLKCNNCHKHIEAEERKAKAAKKVTFDRFITYQGKTISMIDRGDGTGYYKAFKGTRFPKTKTIDLNVFCPNLNRDEVKRLKRIVLELNHAYENIGVIYDKRIKSEV